MSGISTGDAFDGSAPDRSAPECSAPFVLASGSPRRAHLLSEAGFDFEVVKPEVDEIDDPAIPIRTLTARNARLKGEAVAGRRPEAVVLAADTLVLLGERVLGKPGDRAEAAAMLADLSGRTHQVFTAVAIIHGDAGRVSEFTVATDVRFKPLGDGERERYHDLVDPLDKAGAYAAQEHAELIIDGIEGSRTNVVGLPMDEVIAALRDEFGVEP